ncbi:MAG: leucyl aminopeptidase [Gammaproteobacteria bacterium]
MEFSAKSTVIGKQSTPCVVVGVFEGQQLGPAARQLDKLSRGYLRNILKRGDIKGKTGQTLLLHDVPWTKCQRVLLVGCGKRKALDERSYRKILHKTATTLDGLGLKEAVCHLLEVELKGRDLSWKARLAAETAAAALYRSDRLKSKAQQRPVQLRRLHFDVPQREDLKTVRQALRQGKAIAAGAALARDLANLPGNICTPSYLADQARKLAGQDERFKVRVIEEKQMARLKMGALLSVARGSRQAPKLIVLEYSGGRKKDAPYVLVGKGVTFDSGGISIKPAAAMDEMKYDMCGAASVLGTLATISQLGLSINVVGVIPSCENLPDGNASKPGDIVTSMSGKTIEILNTDAEGRLILCDALSYSERFQPRAVIDIATLTGACVIALGKHYSGLLGNDEGLLKQLGQAGEASCDRPWRLPLGEEYQEQLKSNFADLANIGGREGGTITAACFLSRFAENYPWAHLDIAGTAWHSGKNKGATGRPVPLLVQYLLDRVAD